jgi:hypothetical protein
MSELDILINSLGNSSKSFFLEEEIIKIVNSLENYRNTNYLELYDKLCHIVNYPKLNWLILLFKNCNSSYIEWLCINNRISLNHTTIPIILSIPLCDFYNKVQIFELLDLHSRSYYTFSIIKQAILLFNPKILEYCLSKYTEASEKVFKIFIECGNKLNSNSSYNILLLLINHFLTYPLKRKNLIEVNIDIKKKIIINYMFELKNYKFIEYILQILFLRKDYSNKEDKYNYLYWSYYKDDYLIYKKAEIMPISSTYTCPYMGYMTLYYKGNNPNILSLQKQYYMERSYVSPRKMSELVLE